MDDPSSFPTDNRWVATNVNGQETSTWADQHQADIPTGQISNLWCLEFTQHPEVICNNASQSSTGIGDSLTDGSPVLPGPFPRTMSGTVARDQNVPNASSVLWSSRPAIPIDPRKRTFKKAFQASAAESNACDVEKSSLAINVPDGTGTYNTNNQSAELVIRRLAESNRAKDETIMYLQYQLGLQGRHYEVGAAVGQGRKCSQKPKSKIKPTNGDSLGGPIVGPTTRNRFNEIDRMQTAETREIGACIRCRRLRKRCEPGRPCGQCIRLSLKHQRIACIKTRIIEIAFFRQGTTENDTWTRRSEVYNLNDLSIYYHDPPCTVELTQGFGPPLQVQIRKFLPVKGDKTSYHRTLKDGSQHELPMPPYAIYDTDSAKIALENYIESDYHISLYLAAHLDTRNVLLWDTFQIAREGTSDLLQKTLKLWMAARLIEAPWTIFGEEPSDMPPIQDTGSPWQGMSPVTPVMDTQLDQIVIQSILLPLRTEVLQLLQAKFEPFQKKNLFEIFATVFILLNTIEIATKHDHEFANFFGHVSPDGRTRFEDYRLIESYFHGAQTLIAHFRDAPAGHKALMQCSATPGKVAQLAEMGPQETNFMYKLQTYMNNVNREQEFEKLKNEHSYEKPLYWASQLFAKNWAGTPVTIQEKDETKVHFAPE